MLIEFRERKRGVNKQMWYSVLWGSRRALALSSMSVCACVCACANVCIYVCMCYGNGDRRGNKDGAFHRLVTSQDIVDLQPGIPPPTPLPSFSKTLVTLCRKTAGSFSTSLKKKRKKKKTAFRLRAAPKGIPLSLPPSYAVRTVHPKDPNKSRTPPFFFSFFLFNCWLSKISKHMKKIQCLCFTDGLCLLAACFSFFFSFFFELFDSPLQYTRAGR